MVLESVFSISPCSSQLTRIKGKNDSAFGGKISQGYVAFENSTTDMYSRHPSLCKSSRKIAVDKTPSPCSWSFQSSEGESTVDKANVYA